MQVLHSILSCLLDSAIQRTPRGGTVRVHLRYLGEGIQIQVSDCGRDLAEHLNALLQSSATVSCQSFAYACPQVLAKQLFLITVVLSQMPEFKPASCAHILALYHYQLSAGLLSSTCCYAALSKIV